MDPTKRGENWVSKLEKSVRIKCKNYKETSDDLLDKRKDAQEEKRKTELTDDWQVGDRLSFKPARALRGLGRPRLVLRPLKN